MLQASEDMTISEPCLTPRGGIPCRTFGGYVIGLTTTIVVMNVFQAAQPALLYLVPAIIAAAAIPAAYKREFKQASNGHNTLHKER